MTSYFVNTTMAPRRELVELGGFESHTAHSDTEQASTRLVIDLTRANRRMTGDILKAPAAIEALRISNEEDGSSAAVRPSRGDDPVKEDSYRLFFGSGDNPDGTTRLLINGFSIAELDADCDAQFNKRSGYWRPGAVVKALTIDGRGGEMDWEQGLQQPCAWYFIENIFAKPPTDVRIDHFKGSRGKRNDPHRAEWTLPLGFQRAAQQNFDHWFRKIYLPRAQNSVTKRPITEEYFAQLQRSRLDRTKRAEAGEKFFGETNYELLYKQRRKIT